MKLTGVLHVPSSGKKIPGREKKFQKKIFEKVF